MATISCARHRFPPDVIGHTIWLYLRFTLSYRDVEEILAERGLDVSYETIRRWVLKIGLQFARNLHARRPRPSGQWHLDEMVVSIGGNRAWLWRPVDSEGEVLDLLVQSRRDKKAALRLMRKLLRKQAFVPNLLVTDKLRSTTRSNCNATSFPAAYFACSGRRQRKRGRTRLPRRDGEDRPHEPCARAGRRHSAARSREAGRKLQPLAVQQTGPDQKRNRIKPNEALIATG
jgi:transposase-like protein